MTDPGQPGPVTRILDFWFGAPGSAERGRPRMFWFKSGDALDADIRARFGTDWLRAMAGDYDDLTGDARGALAIIILLDQFPRNMFRATAQAFASDSRALQIAIRAVDAGFDRELGELERMFMYLPFEHAEDIAMQDRAVSLMSSLSDPQYLDYAHKHRDIILRFGRYPYRNEVLGRANTAAEDAWMNDPDAESFGQKK
ncbi:MAG: DUF924 family protein [Rhodospirillales bacterium]